MKMRKCWFYFIFFSLLCAITTLSESAPGGTCEVGDIIQPGESCTYPDTNDVFSVDAVGNARFLFFTAGGNLILKNTNINGKRYTLVTEHSAGGGRRITELGDTTAPPVQQEPDRPDASLIFWTDRGTEKIQRANLDGTNVQDLIASRLAAPFGFALDIAGGKMYWTDWATEKIQCANLDGTNVQDLVTSRLDYPSSIALDVAGGKMYWTHTNWNSTTREFINGKIQRANLDGSMVEDLVTGLSSPEGIALDIAGGKMYWTDWSTKKIQRANLNGSMVEDLVTQGLWGPEGIALDVAASKMYWTDNITGKIQRANFDGTNVENLITSGLDVPHYIALDVAGGKMYWTHTNWNSTTREFINGKIQRANLDGSMIEDLITGLGTPAGIALSIPPQTTRKEVVSASVVFPLTEATLDGSIVTLLLTGAAFEQDISKIREAVTVSGINGVTIDIATVQRISDQKITVELDFDGTDFVRDTALTFTLTSKAIANHNGELTTEVPVTASRGEDLLAIFWTDFRTEKIQRANLDMGNLEVSNVEDLVTQGLEFPIGIALDVAGGKMYWADWSIEKIQRANLDGSNVEDLVTQGLESPSGIALDVAGGKMYWTDWRTAKIQRANLDGSNVEDLVTQGLEDPWSIALDVAGGKMYWTDRLTDKIQRANLDGSNVEDLVTQGLESPSSIALDVAGGKMYWTDRDTAKIQRANLDGSNVEDLVTQGLEDPSGIALDVAGGKMYWTDYGTAKIQRANLDGSNVQDLVTGLNGPAGIAIVSSSLVNPTTESTIAKEDVNRDGVVDVNDLVIVAQRYGSTGANVADVNGDEIVNVDDLILVAAAVDNAAAAAPAARAQVRSHFTNDQLQGWLTEARASGNTSHTYQRGIAVIEGLLALLAPEATALLANYPNPFNPETWIPYQLSKPASVTLTIYDIQGHIVRALDLGHQRAGLYQTRSRAAYWDGRNSVGEPVASGLYFYTLTAGDFTATRKMLIRK